MQQNFPINNKNESNDMLQSDIITGEFNSYCHQKNTMETLFEAINIGIVIVKTDGTIDRANQALKNLIGFVNDDFVASNIISLISSAYVAEYRKLFVQQCYTAEQCKKYAPKEVCLIHKNKHLVPVEMSLSTMYSECGEKRFICVVYDISYHKTEIEQLKTLSQIDHLTGMANRREFLARLEKLWGRDCHSSRLLSIIFIDVDHFKKFNDEYGHLKGDICLQKIAEAIVNCLPSKECVAARYGGEEFAVLIPNATMQIAQLTAIRINRAVSELRFDDIGLADAVQITVSIGISQSSSDGVMCPQTCLQTADEALYRAKSSGRNTIITNDGDPALL